MSRLRIGLLVVVVLAAAVVIAIAVTPRWTPEQLRVEAEQRLSKALDSEVQVGAVALALGIGFHLEAENVRLWVGEDGTGLEVETVAIGIEPLSLLLGELRPRRMVLEGATMRIVEGADGRWSPPFEFLDPDPARPERSTDEEILLALNGLERGLRFLLDEPYLADSLRVRDAVVTLSMRGGTGSGSGDPLELRLDLEDGALKHQRLSGEAELNLSGALSGPGGALGRIQWETVRDRHEALTVGLSLESLDLAAAQRLVRRLLPRAQLTGRLGGTADLSWPKPGVARVELGIAVSDFDARAPDGDLALGELRAPEAELEVALDIEDERVHADELRLSAGDLELSLEGHVARPLAPDAEAELDFRAREVDVAGLKALLEWLPASDRAQTSGAIARLLGGRMVAFDLRGKGTVRSWADFFVGARAPLSLGLSGELEAADLALRVGEEDSLERVAIRARWSGDRLDVIEATGELDDDPLPTLHLKIDGVSQWFASDPSLRRISSGALPLSGIPLLWRALSDEEYADPESERFQAALALDIETLQYPLFLWPLEDVHAVVESGQQGLNVLLTRGTWGGVPIEGSADWVFEPTREVYVQLKADVPRSTAQLPPPRYAWARGRFVVHPIESSDWHELSASGRFSADGGSVRLHDVAVDLQPTGTMRGSGSLDLTFSDRVPFQLSAELLGGDIADLSRQLDIVADQASGNLSAWGTFDGTFRDDGSALADISGTLEIDARSGEIWRKLPPVLSIALASEAFNPFAERETIRYASVKTQLDLEDGRMTTESFTLDGPDLRVFADGELDLARPPHEIDADIALFLFRQLDRAIDLIPVLNVLLLGTSENLVAAHFELSGPWNDPEAKLVPLRSFSSGPASLVLEGVPSIVRKGFNAIGAIFDDEEDELDPLSSEPKPFPWES